MRTRLIVSVLLLAVLIGFAAPALAGGTKPPVPAVITRDVITGPTLQAVWDKAGNSMYGDWFNGRLVLDVVVSQQPDAWRLVIYTTGPDE